MAKSAKIPQPFAVPIGLVPTPLQPRLEALSQAKAWAGWAGYITARVLDNVEFEYFAIRNQVTLFDISPMHKYRITGPDALAVMNRLITRDAAKIGIGRVGYAMWCNEQGMVIDDGTIFRFGEADFRLCCQEPMLTWLLDSAWGFDAEIRDESEAIAGLSLQGPTAFSLLAEAGFGDAVAGLKPFDLDEVEPGIWISRTGFTGDLGYELWCGWDGVLALWDRLWAAGGNWGLRAIGGEALDIARIEAGFIAAGVDFQPVHGAIRLGRGRSPLELGFARLVDFEKGHFNGRRALLAERAKGLSHHLVRLDVGGFKPADGALLYHKKKREVGHVTSGIWSPTAKRNVALAELRAPYGGAIRDDLWAEIYVTLEGQWHKRLVPVRIEDKPFFSHPRARATPPNPF